MIFAADRCRERSPNFYVANSISEIERILNPREGDIAIVVSDGAFQVWTLEDVTTVTVDSSDTLPSNACEFVWVRASTGDALTPALFGSFVPDDDSTAVQTANATSLQRAVDAAEAIGGADIIIPPGSYRYNSTLIISEGGVRILGMGSVNRWGQGYGVRPTLLNYTGTGSAVLFTGTIQQSTSLNDIQIDGLSTIGTTDGIKFATDTAGHELTFINFNRCTFSNFPGHQVNAPPCVATAHLWGIMFRDCNFHNRDRFNAGGTSNHLVYFGGPANEMTECTFDNCMAQPYTPATFAYRFQGVSSFRFFSGTILPIATDAANGASGIWINGNLELYGTHIEGQSALCTTNFGIIYAGSTGCRLYPAQIATVGIGIQIGDPDFPNANAESAFICGNICNNQVADIKILQGGSRANTTIADTGRGLGADAVVDDDRVNLDGIYEVTRFDIPATIAGPPGTKLIPLFRSTAMTQTGFFFDHTLGAICWTCGGIEKGRITADGRILLRTEELTIDSAPQILSGTGDPTGVWPAPPGSTFQRVDGGAGTSFYVKEGGGGTAAGWAAK